MRTIFVSIYDGDTEKTILQSDVFKTLCEAEVRVVVLVRNGAFEKFANYANEHVIVEELPPASSFSERLFYWVGWNLIPTNSIRMRRYETFLKNRSLNRLILGSILGWFGRSKWFRRFVRFVYACIPDTYAAELFARYEPHVVFAPNMFSYEDGRLLRAAKRRRIPTVTSAKSWDVLTNKAFTRVIADRILVQNQSIRTAAIDIGDYPPERTVVTGFVQFDYVANKSLLMSRDEFFTRIGADPARKLILYATSGDWKHPYDDEVVEGIHSAIMDGTISQPAQILARFHPKYPSNVERLELPFLIKDRPGSSKGTLKSLDGVTSDVYDFSFTKDDIVHLANSIYHSDVTINTTSTMTLDAVAYDKPVVLIAHDGRDRSLLYWKSLRRMYDENHYREIVTIPCCRIGHSMKETIAAISDYLAEPALDAEGRAKLRTQFLGTLDGKAGERMARSVLELLGL